MLSAGLHCINHLPVCVCVCASQYTQYVRCVRCWMFDAQIQTCSNTVCRCCLLEIHYLAVKCFKSSENNSESPECSPGWRLLLSTPLTPAGLGLHSLSLICWSSALRPLTGCVYVCVCMGRASRERERGLLNIKRGPKTRGWFAEI